MRTPVLASEYIPHSKVQTATMPLGRPRQYSLGGVPTQVLASRWRKLRWSMTVHQYIETPLVCWAWKHVEGHRPVAGATWSSGRIQITILILLRKLLITWTVNYRDWQNSFQTQSGHTIPQGIPWEVLWQTHVRYVLMISCKSRLPFPFSTLILSSCCTSSTICDKNANIIKLSGLLHHTIIGKPISSTR